MPARPASARPGSARPEPVRPPVAAGGRDPLQPLVLVVRIGYFISLAVFVVGVFGLLFRSSGTFGWNGGRACLDIPQQLQARSGPTRVCAEPATSSQAFYSTLANGLSLPFFVVAFGRTSRILTLAAAGGVYRSEVVGRVRALGRFLLFGEVVVVALRTVGSVHLYDELVPGHADGVYWTPFWHVNWTVLLIGVVLVTVARILREGVGMREDLEGTV